MSSSGTGFLGRSSSSNANMRGLVQFIADLRNARARELEEKRINKELANIRQKFKDGSLSGYHKKKYVCKLLYIYILGWNVDFGHLEAVNLISANKYSEKQIGYLAMTLFLHEKHELLHLVVNSIRKDLLDHNELFNCLALHAIANVGSREMGEALNGEVHRLLISPTSKSFVKKKAALTLLRLYRKHPDIISPQWAERIIHLMDDSDLGVALSVTSLVMTLAQDNLEQYKGAYAKAAARLKRILIDGEYTTDYLYYKVPCPWLQIKLLRLLQYFPPAEDTHIREMIRESLQKILNLAMETNKNVQQNNAQNAVLFEAINLIIHLDTEHGLMKQISTRLGKFIQSRETNVRYLGLEAMTHLAARAETLDPIKQHQEIILGSLKDRDISVRRKGLDLLYSMCDATNAQVINKTPANISSFTTTLDLDENEKENLTWDVKNLPDSTIVQGGQSQQVVMFEAKKIFEKSPTVRISYLAGALQALTLKLPVSIHKFMDPAELTAEDFFKRWKQIGGAPREAQAIFGVSGKGDREITESFVTKTVEGFRWRVLDMVDPNPKNVVGASVLHTSQGGKFGCLMRLEPNYGQQVGEAIPLQMLHILTIRQMIRLTIRATDDSVPAVLLKYMQERLAAGISTGPDRFEPPSREQISDSFRNVMVT
ncbi:unnamed protein product [Fusarium fujikuroi]|nr:unnamed protein product [Fusarium fujikuroi]